MKTVKIKVAPNQQQIELFDKCCDDLTWLWDSMLSNQLYNHCIDWYKWAEKQNKKLLKSQSDLQKLKPDIQAVVIDYYYPRPDKQKPRLNQKIKDIIAKFAIFEQWEPFDLEGIIKTPLNLRDSAYLGMACRIAVGGKVWKRDDNTVIAYKNKNGEIVYKKGSKLVESGKPYKSLSPTPHSYKSIPDGKFAGKLLERCDYFDNLTGLNSLRKRDNLPEIVPHSDFVGGIKNLFKTAWLSFLNPSLSNRGKPRFKRDQKVTTLINDQHPPKIDPDSQTIEIKTLGKLAIADKSAFKRLSLDKFIPLTYSISKKPSGWYINIVIAHPLNKNKTSIEKQLPTIKKYYGENSSEYINAKAEHGEIISKIEQSQHASNKGLSVGVDPGVSAVIGTDSGSLFRPNITRERISIHIEKLQSQLDNIELINNKKWQDAGNNTSRPPTKNELKLKAKIARLHEKGANSSKAFNHKLSTRLSQTYDIVCWEDTHLTNLLKQVEAKASPDGTGYEQNGASAKRGLNWILRQRCLGDLKAKTKTKRHLRKLSKLCCG